MRHLKPLRYQIRKKQVIIASKQLLLHGGVRSFDLLVIYGNNQTVCGLSMDTLDWVTGGVTVCGTIDRREIVLNLLNIYLKKLLARMCFSEIK